MEANDLLNARLVAQTRIYADKVITTHSATSAPSATSATPPGANATAKTPTGVNVRGEVVKGAQVSEVQGMTQALFIETGFGACQKGIDVNKAAVRAARNAIEFNSVPAIRVLCNGRDRGGNMVVRVSIAVPRHLVHRVDLSQVRSVFPHGDVTVTVQEGGGLFCSGVRQVEGLEKRDEMLLAVAHVVVGRR